MKALLFKNISLTEEDKLTFPVEDVLSGEYPWMESVVIIDYDNFDAVSEEDACALVFNNSSSVIRLDEYNKVAIPQATW